MIPKVIHYCWFGGNPKSEIIETCIASWKMYCPDWEIKEWNESNYDVNAHPYMKEAYEAKKWAFVTDVARLEIIARYGGVYMDTDVELLNSVDALMEQDAFFFFETDRNIASGLGFGAAAGHGTVKAMLAVYDDRHFLVNGKPDLSPCPAKNTEALRDLYPAFMRNGKTQYLDGTAILSCGDYASFARHHGTMSWVDGHKGSHIYKDTKLKRILRKPEYFDWIEQHLGKKATAVYTFAVYDLLEMGPVYYVKRIIHKLRK